METGVHFVISISCYLTTTTSHNSKMLCVSGFNIASKHCTIIYFTLSICMSFMHDIDDKYCDTKRLACLWILSKVKSKARPRWLWTLKVAGLYKHVTAEKYSVELHEKHRIVVVIIFNNKSNSSNDYSVHNMQAAMHISVF